MTVPEAQAPTPAPAGPPGPRGIRKLTKINTTAALAAVAATITAATLVLSAIHSLIGQVQDIRKELQSNHVATTQEVQSIADASAQHAADITAKVDEVKAQVSAAPMATATTLIIRETPAPTPRPTVTVTARPVGKTPTRASGVKPAPSPTPTPAPGLLGFLTPRG